MIHANRVIPGSAPAGTGMESTGKNFRAEADMPQSFSADTDTIAGSQTPYHNNLWRSLSKRDGGISRHGPVIGNSPGNSVNIAM